MGKGNFLLQISHQSQFPFPVALKINVSDHYLIASANPSVLFGTNSVGVLGTIQSSSSLNGPGAGCP